MRMTSRRIFILLGHPDSGPEPLSRQLADAYEAAARAAGHEVRRRNLSDLAFDPVLHKGYRAIQELEPDLKAVQEDISWCEHFVLAYPNWWGGMPGPLKGMWDRLFLPRFAFRMWKNRFGWDALLKGRSARVFITCGNPVVLDHLAFGDFTASIKRSLLQFAGFRTRVSAFGRAETASPRKQEVWKRNVARLAKRGM
jgi:putative NADPH-quinone reductase